MKVQECNLAWLAGMIDGEGCIGLYKYKRTKVPRHTVVRPCVTIVNSHKDTMLYIAKIYESMGISYSWGERKQLGTRNKPTYSVAVQGRDGVTVLLEAVLPYLFTKKKQADICKMFLSRIKFSRITNEDLGLVDQMRVLNRKGVHV